MDERCNAKESNKDDRGDLAGIIVVEEIFRSWNNSFNQGKHAKL